jgi:protein-histidine N-methyltransferase
LTWYFHSQVDQADPNGEIEVTQELIEDFETSLKNRKITFEFYSGSWDSLDQAGAFDQSDAKRNIVLTSETIYSTQSLPSLVNALELACNGSIESSMQRAALTDTEDKSKSRSDLCLVAAKVLYFGVGGGVDAFNEHIKRRQGSTKTVWKSERGVSRLVLQVDFGAAAS